MSWQDRNISALENLAIIEFCVEHDCKPNDIEEVQIDSNVNGKIDFTVTLKKHAEYITLEGVVL